MKLIYALLLLPAFAIADDVVLSAPPVQKEGEVYQVVGGKLEKVDMTRFYILPVDWAAANNSFELGLRSDGVVTWRKKP